MSEHIMSENILSFSAAEAPERAKAIAPRVRSERNRQTKSLEYRLLFGLTFLVFLVGSIIEAVIPFRVRKSARGQGLIQRARDGAHTCVHYSFMG